MARYGKLQMVGLGVQETTRTLGTYDFHSTVALFVLAICNVAPCKNWESNPARTRKAIIMRSISQ